MTSLKIQQGSNVEIVNANIISKLYEIVLSISEPQSGEEDDMYLSGNLQTDYAYRSNVNYLTTRFPELFINVTNGYYIDFQDSAVYNILKNAGIGDGTGITEAQAAAVTNQQVSGRFYGNTDITHFDEFGLFTNINNPIPFTLFKGCSNLVSIDMSNVRSMARQIFDGCTSLSIELSLPLYESTGIGDGAFKNTAITKVLNLGGCTSIGLNCFRNCTNLTQVVLPSTCTRLQQEAFAECSNLSSINVENIITMGSGVFGWTSFSNIFYFKELLNEIAGGSDFPRNGLFVGGAPHIYAPKLQAISGGYDTGGNDVRGLVVSSGWNSSRSNKKIIYFKDLASVETGAFCGGIIKHLIINNTTPPTVTQHADAKQNLLIDVSNSGVSSSVVQNVWVPDSAVNTYKAHTYWGEFGSRIQGLSGLSKVATKALWDQLSDSAKEDTLVEEYM